MHQESLRLVLVDEHLRLAHQVSALLHVGRLTLRFRDLVIGRIVVADEVEALGRGRRMIEIEDELVGIAALGAADHAPHGHVPLLALVPYNLDVLLPG